VLLQRAAPKRAPSVSSSMTRPVPPSRQRVARLIAGVVLAATALVGGTSAAVAATSPTLVVTVLGGGTVTSTPAGVACPGRCTASFAPGTSVALTAAPKPGGNFLGWGGSCTGTGACTLRMSALKAVAAQFSPATNTSPPGPTNYVAAPGPYSGSFLSFFVSAEGNSILNVSKSYNALDCEPSGAVPQAGFAILQVPVQPNGAFSSKTTEHGVYNNSEATFTYTFAGRFEAATTTTPANATGTWREDFKMTSGTIASCTSGTKPFTATLYREPPFQRSDIKAGNYKGQFLSFSVAPGGNAILNISKSYNALSCEPSGAIPQADLTIGEVPVGADGSFSAKTSQTGVLNGVPTKVTYTFVGSFEGTTPFGTSTVAGIMREDIVPTSGPTTLCTTNNLFWRASLQP